MPGEFTRKFDRAIMKKLSHQDPETEELRRERLTRERFEAEVDRIMELLDYRGRFLQERFPNMQQESEGVAIKRFIFEPSQAYPKRGVLEFKLVPTDTHQALFFQMTMEIEGCAESKSDYVALPIDRVDMEKAKGFVEATIFEFARLYTR